MGDSDEVRRLREVAAEHRRKVDQARKDYNDAVREFGADSQQAQDAKSVWSSLEKG